MRLNPRRVNGCAVGRPEMHDDSQPEEPKYDKEHKVDSGGEEATLKELP